jgi:hypothetical protein
MNSPHRAGPVGNRTHRSFATADCGDFRGPGYTARIDIPCVHQDFNVLDTLYPTAFFSFNGAA